MSGALEALGTDPGQGWIVVVGATATGKTALGIEIARRFDGEILSADSRLVYRETDIATAKPTMEERGGIPHHGIDLADPDAPWTLGDYLSYARPVVADMESRGKRVVIVGGTGLYVDALVGGYGLPGEATDDTPLPPLEEMLAELDARSPEDARIVDRENPRRVARVYRYVRVHGPGFYAAQKRAPASHAARLIGLAAPESQEARIRARVDTMLERGLLAEAEALFRRYPPGAPGLSGIGYPEAREHLEGRTTLDEMREAIILATRRYAKRQRTWFRRNASIRWWDIDADAPFS